MKLLWVFAAPWALVPLAALAAAPGEGRWEGLIAVPGAPQPLVIDLVRERAGPVASLILPGRGVKGAPLRELVDDGDALRASLAAALPFASDTPPLLTLRAQGADRAQGELSFGGQVARVSLQRTGPAQLDRPPVNRPLGPELAGRWTGRYELFGAPREVTLTLAGSQAEMTIVGRRTTRISFDSVHQGARFLALSGNEYGIAFEGRWAADGGPIEGTFQQGSIELPLRLTRAAKGG